MNRIRIKHLNGLWLCVLVCGELVTANVIRTAEKNNLQDHPGLYGKDDKVFVLNAKNFDAHVYDGKRAWLVEFYVSWCGFCQRLAPHWKAFTEDVYGWKDISAVAAIDCSNYINVPTCRKYGNLTYPTVKYFHMKSNNDELGVFVRKENDVTFLRHMLVDLLTTDEWNELAGPNWPFLMPNTNVEINKLWESVPSSVQYQFLIFEEPAAYIGSEVILDLHKLENVKIVKITSSNSDLQSALYVEKFPTLVVIERNNKSEHLNTEIFTREELVKKITGFLNSKGISTESKEDEFDKIHNANQLVKVEDKQEDLHLTGDKLYLLDLERAVRDSLNKEIPLAQNITGERMTALKTFLKTLAIHIPNKLAKLKIYLNALQGVIETKTNITGDEFKKQVKDSEKGLIPIYAPARTWIGCRGSTSNFRGYPCGLWTLFHTLTVSAAVKDAQQVDTLSVLAAMHGYIKNFFGCADCAQHFLVMSDEMKLFDSRNRDSDVLWLWQAHNKVNNRLAGDVTEDPQHKKIQYPAAEHCRDCRFSEGNWNEPQVLKYLKEKYTQINDVTV